MEMDTNNRALVSSLKSPLSSDKSSSSSLLSASPSPSTSAAMDLCDGGEPVNNPIQHQFHSPSHPHPHPTISARNSQSSPLTEKTIGALPPTPSSAAPSSSSSSASIDHQFLNFRMPPDCDSCHVCSDDSGSTENPIVYCDLCNVGVHQNCYGFPLTKAIPEDDWACARCEAEQFDATCVLCPLRYGVMKRTTDFKWCHLACAQWIPEAFFRLGAGREPIDYLQIPHRRFGRRCIHCHSNYGACLECSEPKCKRSFHVTCGMRENIYLEYKETSGADIIVSFCSEHSKQLYAKKNTRIRPKH